jgi:hypothetical protein
MAHTQSIAQKVKTSFGAQSERKESTRYLNRCEGEVDSLVVFDYGSSFFRTAPITLSNPLPRSKIVLGSGVPETGTTSTSIW